MHDYKAGDYSFLTAIPHSIHNRLEWTICEGLGKVSIKVCGYHQICSRSKALETRRLTIYNGENCSLKILLIPMIA